MKNFNIVIIGDSHGEDLRILNLNRKYFNDTKFYFIGLKPDETLDKEKFKTN